jgi:PknH-like extracellular domain
VKKYLAGLIAAGVTVAGCAGHTETAAPTTTPKTVEDRDLDNLMLSVADINTVMGTTGITPHPVVTQMPDNRNLLPNLNCLGVWQVDEAAIYGERGGPTGWSALRQQMLRTPDADQWDTLAVQSVVSYPSPDAARAFFGQSADRWSKCTNHHVNIKLNDQPLPKWLSGDLDQTDTSLAMPIARGAGADSRSCQHVLTVKVNVVIDVEACKPQTYAVTQAADIAGKIASAISS